MNTVGFPISHKENEHRRALLPEDVKKLKAPQMLYFEEGYGDVLAIRDEEYIKAGANIAPHEKTLQCNVICDPKIGDADYLSSLKQQTVFGWIHAVQNKEISDTLVHRELTAFAWEDMFEDGRHVFWRNNELAGEAAVMDAFKHYGKMPYECNVAILGRGNVAQGALKLLTLLGANVTSYSRNTEQLFRKELPLYDVIVNCILWDTKRTDHIIYCSDIKRLKQGALIIDISCDRNGGIEFSIPTTIEEPFYYYEGIMVYAVDHTPSLFYKTASNGISQQVVKYMDELIEGSIGSTLSNCMIIKDGKILDKRILDYQNRQL